MTCDPGSVACVCSGTTVCGTCASWSFESGVAAPWGAILDPINGAYNTNGVSSVQSSADRATSGSRSLKVSFNYSSFAEIGAQLCSSSTTPLQNYAMTFDFYSATYSGWVVGIAWNSATQDWASISMVYTTPGSWQNMTGTFGTAVNANYIAIYMSGDGSTISGTAYIDNIYLSH